MTPIARPRPRYYRGRKRTSVALALVGAVLLAWLVKRADPVGVWLALRRGVEGVPVIVALEGLRILIEALGSRKLYATRIPFPLILRATLVAYAVLGLAPAGRASGEAVKAGMLGGASTLSDTAAAATTIQTCSLLALGFWSLVCAVVAGRVSRPLAATLVVQAGIVLLGATIIHGGSRTSGLGRFLGRFWPKAEERLDAVREHASRQRLGAPFLAFTLSRALEMVQYAVIFQVVTRRFAFVPALLTFGVATVAGTLGDSIPVQLGVIGATLSAASSILGISRADAVAFGALAHAFHLFWVAIGLLTPFVWRIRTSEGPRR